MKETYIYLRKSRKDIRAEKHGDGETLSKHKKILLDLAERLKIFIREENIFYEMVSGETIENRPEMKKLLNKIYEGIVDSVMVVDIDRISRGDGDDQVKIKKAFKTNGVKIITLSKTFDLSIREDEEYIDLLFFFGHREYNVINDRIQRGRNIAALEGKYVGNITPFGYDRVPLNHSTGFTLQENIEEAKIVRLIFELYTKGTLQKDGSYRKLGPTLIARKLNELGFKPRKNTYWSTTTIQGILRNSVYIGKIRWNTRPQVTKIVDGQDKKIRPRNTSDSLIEVDGLHKAIINNEIWNLAQKYIKENSIKRVPSNSTIKNPLAGLIICKRCRHKMTRRPYQDRQEPSLICSNISCNNISSKLSIVENKLINGLKEILVKYKLDIKNTENGYKNNEQIELLILNKLQIENEIEKLQIQQDSIMTRIDLNNFDEIYTKEIAYDRLRKIKNTINTFSINIENIQKEIKKEQFRQERLSHDIPIIENIIDLYFKLPSAKMKNDLLKEVIEKVYYYKDVNARWHNDENDFQLIIYTKLK